MFKRVNSNKNGVIEYSIDSVEDLDKLPRKETDNTVYAVLNKDGKRLVYLYSKAEKDYILINRDLEGINEQLETIATIWSHETDMSRYIENLIIPAGIHNVENLDISNVGRLRCDGKINGNVIFYR